MVVASFRPEESGEDLDGLRDDESVLNVALERLDDDAIANVAADMLALWPLPDGFRRFLVDSAEGNPFFVAQYLRTAVAEGLLLRDASGQWRMRRVDVSQAQPLEDALPLPATLRDLAVRRLAGLSPTARAVLEHSSVLGRDVDGALLALVSGLEELRIAEGVAELVRRHCVMETGDGLRFRHATLRDVAYESVAADARVAMHRRAAECLESAGRARETLPALALHWERAGATDRAVACYAEAARAARGRYAWRESEQLLRSLLRLCPEPSLHRTAAHASLGSVLTHRGRFAEAVQEHALGLEDARAIGDARWEGRSLVDIAGAEQILGDAERARARYEAGIAILHAIGEQRLEANAIENLAVLLQNAGVTQAAEACHQSALGMFRELGSVNGQLTALTNLGGLRAEQGRWQEAIAIMEEGLALARASGERESEALLTGNIGSIRHARGWLREARDFYDRARPIFHEIGGRLGEATLLANLAHLALEQGHTADARLLLSESRALSEEIGGLRQLTFVRLIEGWLAEAEGRYDAASAAYREALRRIEGKGPLLESLAWLALGALETTLGRCDAAEQSLRGAVRLLEGQDDALMHAAVDIARARLLRRSGGSRDERRTLLLAIEIKLRELVELLRLAECLCEQGHLLLEEGGDATRLLDEAMSLVDQGGAGPGSPARQRIDELARAIAYGPRGGPGTVR
ncbi:MAG: tetratricopeptide repeat protein [Acidobacteriota bacterium]